MIKIFTAMSAALIVATFWMANSQQDVQAKEQHSMSSHSKSNETGLKLVAQVRKTAATSGDRLTLILTLKNTSKKTVDFVDVAPAWDFRLVVQNAESGQPVPLTKRGEVAAQGGFSTGADGIKFRMYSKDFVSLKSGQSKRYVIPLNNLYKITSAGTYFVTAKRIFPKPKGKGMVTIASNTVTVKVTKVPLSPIIKAPVQ